MFLTLRRRVGEEIIIDYSVQVVVLGVEGKVVRLGISAPGKTIHRREIYDAMRERPAGVVYLPPLVT